LAKAAQRIQDREMMHLLKLLLQGAGKRGVPQGGVASPLLSNLYLNAVDSMLERAKEKTRIGQRTAVEYARFADDLVVLIGPHPRQCWLREAVAKRLREELAILQVTVNETKSRIVDLAKGESFGCLGFDFRRIQSRAGRWMPLRLPQGKKRTALLRRLKEEFRRLDSQPVTQVIAVINPILRGWVTYFAFGHASRCFAYVRRWVEKKVRRHLARACKRRGFGWKRWRSQGLYETLGLFAEYRVTYRLAAKAAPA
jgi:RNA-directed DNA polymerase